MSRTVTQVDVFFFLFFRCQNISNDDIFCFSFFLVLRNAFTAFESPEKKGVIATSDLATIVEMLGHRLDDQKQKQAIREADPRGTGELEFEAFAVYASRYVEVEEDVEAVAKELREAFLLYDRDGMALVFQYFYALSNDTDSFFLRFSQRLYHR